MAGAATEVVKGASGGAEARLRGFIAKFDRGRQALIRALRKELRKRFPTAYELVYDTTTSS
jgi:hypothetical protein